MVILENIDIDKAILQNIDIDKISNRFKFGISNRARLGSDKNGGGRLDFFLLFNTLVLSFCRLSQGVRVKPIMVIPRFRKRPLYKVLPCRSKQWKWQNRRHWLPTRGANSPLARSRRSTCGTLWRLVFNHYDDSFFKILKVGLQSMHDSFQYLQKQLNRRWRNIFWNASRSSALSLLASRWVVTSPPLLKYSHTSSHQSCHLIVNSFGVLE